MALARVLGGRTVVAGDEAQGFHLIHLQAAAEFGKLVWRCKEGVLTRNVGYVTGV